MSENTSGQYDRETLARCLASALEKLSQIQQANHHPSCELTLLELARHIKDIRQLLGLQSVQVDTRLETQDELLKELCRHAFVRGISTVSSDFAKERGRRAGKGGAGHEIFGMPGKAGENAFPEGAHQLPSALGLSYLSVPNLMRQQGAQSMVALAPVSGKVWKRDNSAVWTHFPYSMFGGEEGEKRAAYQLVYYISDQGPESSLPRYMDPIHNQPTFSVVSIVLPEDLARKAFERIAKDPAFMRVLLSTVDRALVSEQACLPDGTQRTQGLPDDDTMILFDNTRNYDGTYGLLSEEAVNIVRAPKKQQSA